MAAAGGLDGDVPLIDSFFTLFNTTPSPRWSPARRSGHPWAPPERGNAAGCERRADGLTREARSVGGAPDRTGRGPYIILYEYIYLQLQVGVTKYYIILY